MSFVQHKCGFTLESVLGLEFKDETLKFKGLLKYLSSFDVSSQLKDNTPYISIFSVIHNIISRGTPTLCSKLIENELAISFPNYLNNFDVPKYCVGYNLNINKNDLGRKIFNALHIIEPRASINVKNYNTSNIESKFEESFLFNYLPSNLEFLVQILEPQRLLSSILPESEQNHFVRQRADFTIEIPYLYEENIELGNNKEPVVLPYKKGFVVEVDGAAYHGWSQQKLDIKRDESLSQYKWNTTRVNSNSIPSGIKTLNEKLSTNEYLKAIEKNFNKEWDKEWTDTLQLALTPFCIARIQFVLLKILANNAKEHLKIVILERDVPCGYLALKDLVETYNNLKLLHSKPCPVLPDIDLEIYTTKEFLNSPLHRHKKPLGLIQDYQEDENTDWIIDNSILLRSNIIKQDKERDENWITVRSSHYFDTYKPRKFKTTNIITYKEIVSKEKESYNKPYAEMEESLEFFLQNIFRKRSFRVGQLPILDRALQNKTVIGLLPTGGGKSLTYQLAAILQPGITLVVDPIKSLMQDQYDNLVKLGIDGCNFINSSLSTTQRIHAINHLKKGEMLISFLSPERLQIKEFRDAIQQMHNNGIYFSYCVIDEVHCLSEWGHDFRPAYLKLGSNAIKFCKTKSQEPITLFGLTATASYDVLADIERELSLPDAPLDSDAVVRYENTTRNELQYNILPVNVEVPTQNNNGLPDYFPSSLENRKARDLVGEAKQKIIEKELYQQYSYLKRFNSPESLKNILIHAHNHLIPYEERVENPISYAEQKFNDLKLKLEEPFFDKKHSNAGIIFCPHKSEKTPLGVLKYKQILSANGLKTGWYMGSSGFSVVEQEKIENQAVKYQKDFIDNKLDLMIATKAFGMGIDKPNIRFTWHINYPSSIESFVQEGGRAGRDRQLAIVNLLYNNDSFAGHNLSKVAIDRLSLPDSIKQILKQTRKQLFKWEDFENKILPNLSSGNIEYERILTKSVFKKQTVDKEVPLFFLHQSFKGIDKELTILDELFNTIHCPRLSKLDEIANDMSNQYEVGKFTLKHWQRNNLNRIYCNIDNEKIGYLNLADNLKFRTEQQQINSIYSNYQLLQIIQQKILEQCEGANYETWLNTPNQHEKREGILRILEGLNIDEEHTLNIPFQNVLSNIKFRKERVEVFVTTNNQRFTSGYFFESKNPFKSLNSFAEFKDMLIQNTTFTDDSLAHLPPTQIKKLENLYLLPRDDADTAKAIYRLFCLGIIKDYTVDYNIEEYSILFERKPVGEYKNALRKYLLRYLSENKVNKKIEPVATDTISNEINQSMKVLIEFVYEQIAQKRERGIEDMQTLCEEAVKAKDLFDANNVVKEFIYTYFNSKYAREKPAHEVDGKNYSLAIDTEGSKLMNWSIVYKYMEIVGIDPTGGFDDNIKHLRGASIRLLRTNPDNAALLLLKGFTFLMLFSKLNREELKQEGEQAIWEGILKFAEDDNVQKDTLDKNTYNLIVEKITRYKEIIASYSEDKRLIEYIDTLILGVSLKIQNDWLDNTFKPKFLK